MERFETAFRTFANFFKIMYANIKKGSYIKLPFGKSLCFKNKSAGPQCLSVHVAAYKVKNRQNEAYK